MLRKFIIIALLWQTVNLQAQEYRSNLRNRDQRLLKRNNFDPFYEGKNGQVNEYLDLALRKNKNANGWLIASGVISAIPGGAYITPPGFVVGYSLKQQSTKQIRIATLFHISTLTDQVYSGREDFRRDERIRWFEKKNLHLRFYSGENETINQALSTSWDLKQVANRDMFYASISGAVGGTLLLVSFINFIVNTFSEGNDPVLWPFAAGAALTTTGTILFIRSDKKKNQIELNLWNAAEQWYSELHSDTEKPNDP